MFGAADEGQSRIGQRSRGEVCVCTSFRAEKARVGAEGGVLRRRGWGRAWERISTRGASVDTHAQECAGRDMNSGRRRAHPTVRAKLSDRARASGAAVRACEEGEEMGKMGEIGAGHPQDGWNASAMAGLGSEQEAVGVHVRREIR